MTLEQRVRLRPSVTHIKGTGRSAAFRGPGLEGDEKGKRDSSERGDFPYSEPARSPSLAAQRLVTESSLAAVQRRGQEARAGPASSGAHFLIIRGVSPAQDWEHGETENWVPQPSSSEERSRSMAFITPRGIACSLQLGFTDPASHMKNPFILTSLWLLFGLSMAFKE